MLGKQCWRFLRNPQSLVCRVFRGRYIPGKTTDAARLGNNPSFMWRSIFESFNTFMSGCRIRIGDGANTEIGGSPWLPDQHLGLVTSTLPPNVLHSTVQTLIDPIQRVWNRSLINSLFNNRDRELILSIPIGRRCSSDNWYWLYDSKGNYTVKSCYKLLIGPVNGCVAQHPHGFWNTIWHLPVPSKVKDFIWRAASEVLPCSANLLKKRVAVPEKCKVCNAGIETTFHSLIQCSFAKLCWLRSSIGLVVPVDDFCSWLGYIFQNYDVNTVAYAVSLCWYLWKNRNCVVWDGKFGSVNSIINGAGRMLFAHQYVQSILYFPSAPIDLNQGLLTWQKPPADYIKCNVDAGVFHSQGFITCGAIIRDHYGKFQAARSEKFFGYYAAPDAEVMAVHAALLWLKTQNRSPTIVETDCFNLYQALTNDFSGCNAFSNLVGDCLLLASSMNNVSFSFVRRQGNNAAHTIARVASSMYSPSEWRVVLPLWLLSHI